MREINVVRWSCCLARLFIYGECPSMVNGIEMKKPLERLFPIRTNDRVTANAVVFSIIFAGVKVREIGV